MKVSLEARIRKLESLLPAVMTNAEIGALDVRSLLMVAGAFYLGNPTPSDPPAAAHARALGYTSQFAYAKAMMRKDAGFKKRFSKAADELLAKFGVSWEDKPDVIMAALDAMERGLPSDYVEILNMRRGFLERVQRRAGRDPA